MAPYEMIRQSPVAAIITNPRAADNPVIACNNAFIRLTGYEEADIIGRNCRFLAGPGTEPAQTALLREAIRDGHPAMVELLNYRKDGTPFRNAVMIAPIFDDRGDLTHFVGSQVEVRSSLNAGSSHGDASVRLDGLSPRQRQVLLAMAAGRTGKQIAFALGITERTVKMHRSALMRALGVRTAVEAIRIAIAAGH